MKRDEALQLTNSALEELTAAVDRGQSETLTAYLDTMARFHNYSFGNILLISVQRPDATHVAGYNAWLNRCPSRDNPDPHVGEGDPERHPAPSP